MRERTPLPSGKLLLVDSVRFNNQGTGSRMMSPHLLFSLLSGGRADPVIRACPLSCVLFCEHSSPHTSPVCAYDTSSTVLVSLLHFSLKILVST